MGIDQPWEMHEPTRGILSQSFYPPLTAWGATEPRRRFQERKICFACSILPNTLSVGNADTLSLANLAQKCINKRGFANTRLTGNEYNLPFAGQRLLKRLVELGEFDVATNDVGGWVGD
jgi:hypothetical protein